MNPTALPKTAAEALDPSLPPLQQLLRIMARLRAPDGCPWDREQNHSTLRASVIEEAYEVAAAINTGDDANLREELGDLLLQVVFHAQLASEENRFSFDDIASAIAEKLVRRHPHVFGTENIAHAAEVVTRWEDIKKSEKAEASESLLDGIAPGLPALLHADKIQKKAAKIGFDWDATPPVVEKIREEIRELETELQTSDAGRLEEELGDLLFSVVNLARKLQINAETALQKATDKFSARFREMETLAKNRNLSLESMQLNEMDTLWEEVKSR